MSSIRLAVIGESSGAPTPGGATSSYLVQASGFPLVLDMGSASLSRLSSIIDFNTVTDVILSHRHPDHMADAPVAVYSRLIQMQLGKVSSPLVFHCPEDLGLEDDPYSHQKLVCGGTCETIGPFTVRYMETHHPVKTLATRLECGGRTLVYTADGALCDDLVSFCHGADILIAECSFYPGKGRNSKAGHMNADDCALLASRARPSVFIATHLPVYGDRREIGDYIKSRFDDTFHLASPLLEVEV